MAKTKLIIAVIMVLVLGLIGVNILSKTSEEPPEATDMPTETPETNETIPEEQTIITPADTIITPERGYLLGVLPIPYDGQDFDQAYQKAAETCELVPVWGRPSPYWEKATDLEGLWGQLFVEEYTRGNCMAPVLHFSFIGDNWTVASPEGTSYTLSSPEWRAEYKQAVIDSVVVCRPVYLSVGNEVNRWYEVYGMEGENGFSHWISLYEEIYDAVKEISPETKIFCTFSREIVNENREADLTILTQFNPEKIDILALTSYPYCLPGVNQPTDIPSEYYASILEYIPDTPLGFTEIAWTSIEFFGGEQGQADFINMLDELTEDTEIEFIMWPWLSDLTDQDKTGLISRSGEMKKGYYAWTEL